MAELLRIDHLSAGYGSAVVLNDVSVTLEEGQSLAILGRNGAGKTTLIASIVGVTHRFAGTVTIGGRDITRLPPERRAVAGIGWVPQERNIFRSLTVEENLTAVMRAGPWTLNRIYGLFPRLKERRANMGSQLSGGEQQMLAIGRALAVNPLLLLLDEPTEGLAPILVGELQKVLSRIMHDDGVSTLVVEQRPQRILNATDRAIILERGMVVHQGASVALRSDTALLERHLGVTARGSSSAARLRAAPHPGAGAGASFAERRGTEPRRRNSDRRICEDDDIGP